MKRYAALVFSVDGALAETEELHRRAFNDVFRFFDLGWVWDIAIYRKLLRVTGGKDRIRYYLQMYDETGHRLSDHDIADLHRFKTARFRQLIQDGQYDLRPGVAELIAVARERGQRLAIVTTTARENVDTILTEKFGLLWKNYFAAVVAGDDVERQKPAPDAYLKVLDILGLPGRDCLAIEDSRDGLDAARAAGMPVLITRSMYSSEDGFDDAQAVVDNLKELRDFRLKLI